MAGGETTDEAFTIGAERVGPGERRTVELPISVLSDHTPVTLSVHVVRGRRPGPTLFVSAAVHGDEIVGVEIIRRLLRASALRMLRGTLLCIPVVNAFGFIARTRYLPDRRDLNRSFPGSTGGSLAGRIAHLFMEEVVRRADFGIDLHSAAVHRTNLPQIRIGSDDAALTALAHAFGAPVVMHAPLREGSLRRAAHEAGVGVLVYEAGEALRFDELAVRGGVRGVLRVMRSLDMVPERAVQAVRMPSLVSRSSAWVRAPDGGILRAHRLLGEMVSRGEVVGVVSDPFGHRETEIRARHEGLVIGRTNLPVVNLGDALLHVARVSAASEVEQRIDAMERELGSDPLFDEDEIL